MPSATRSQIRLWMSRESMMMPSVWWVGGWVGGLWYEWVSGLWWEKLSLLFLLLGRVGWVGGWVGYRGGRCRRRSTWNARA